MILGSSEAGNSWRASDGGKNVTVGGGGESARSQKWERNISTILHQGIRRDPDSLPEYGGLGGMGGHSNLPTESEKDGAPTLTLSRLQLLGVGLTFSTQKHGKSLNRLWDYTRHHGEHMHISDGRYENWKVIQNDQLPGM